MKTYIYKKELREEIKRLRFVGSLMANVCFNLSQKEAVIHNREALGKLVKKWDAIKPVESNLRKEKVL